LRDDAEQRLPEGAADPRKQGLETKIVAMVGKNILYCSSVEHKTTFMIEYKSI
jgi:hypothetical protein